MTIKKTEALKQLDENGKKEFEQAFNSLVDCERL